MPRLFIPIDITLDRKDIFDRVYLSSDYIDEDTGSTFLNFDCTNGPISYTPPTLTLDDKGVVKIIKDAKGLAATNKITILASVIGEETPVIGTNYGSLEIRWNGSAWERLREERNLWDYDEITKTLQPKDPFTLFANAIKGGTKAVIKSQNYDDLSNPGLNVDDDGSSFGNEFLPGADDETDGAVFTYEGGASTNGHDDNVSTYDSPGTFSEFSGGLVYKIDLGQGNKRAINELYVIVGQGYYLDYEVSWSDDGLTWAPIFIHTSNIFNSHPRVFQWVNSVGEKRHWRIRVAMPNYGGSPQYSSIRKFKLRENVYATTSNKVETNFGESNKTISGLKAYDENGDLITDETKVLVEYSTDNKTSWSTQETLASFNSSDNVVSSGVFEVRFAAVGDQRISRIDRVGPNSVLEASETGFSFSIDGLNEFNFDSINGIQARKVSIGENDSFFDVTENGIVFKKDGQNLFEFTEENGVEVEGISINSRLDEIENKPSEEVEDIAGRNALTPVLDQIVLINDDGTGEPAVHKYDGSNWIDITALSGGISLVKANEAKAESSQALLDAQVASSTASQALGDVVTVRDDADAAMLAAQDAQDDADAAQLTANSASSAAGVAQSTANSALSAAGVAQSTAQDAQDDADAAMLAAQDAQDDADAAMLAAQDAQGDADIAQSTAEDAQDDADAAQLTANSASSAAGVAQSTANSASSAASAAQDGVDQLNDVLNQQEVVFEDTNNDKPTTVNLGAQDEGFYVVHLRFYVGTFLTGTDRVLVFCKTGNRTSSLAAFNTGSVTDAYIFKVGIFRISGNNTDVTLNMVSGGDHSNRSASIEKIERVR